VLGRHLKRQAKRGIQRSAHGVGQIGRAPADGSEQLMQPGERQMRLRLHAGGGEHQHATLPRGQGGIRQEPRLANTGLAAKQKRLAARRDLLQQ
jgi:hypothetical protein